ncbi:hypothetical protein [Micromonospora carbonacea]|uniref:Uncharacterized protein n=1 Tax=Micromonospora carbonacea TaxID=47853 RepID=A0A1C5AYV9_9ACTN|nr:hypothetical protein [Micromonospora carbonacea]SCF50400.1 hypothetical protein GA0070563_13125 [Micromonospora carbonacea]
MIKVKTCHTIHCDGDNCNATIEHDYEPHFEAPGYAREEAEDAFEWWCKDGVDLCRNCKLRPHPFMPEDPKLWPNSVHCDRCGLEADEHELDVAARTTEETRPR